MKPYTAFAPVSTSSISSADFLPVEAQIRSSIDACRPYTNRIGDKNGFSTRCNEILTAEERWLVDLSFEYRVLYYFKIYPHENLLAWKGACWCSSDPIGPFPYGPGPDDPSLPAKSIQRFFNAHTALLTQTNPVGRKLALADENLLNRHCLVLGLFEAVVRRGLFNCSELPLFEDRSPLADLADAPGERIVREMTRLSYNFCFEFRDMEMDILRRLNEKRRVPLSSPLAKVA